MIGLGTVINVAAIIAGGLLGMVFGRFLQDRHQGTLNMACGVCVLFIGMAGTLSGMISIEGGALISGHSMLVIACMAPGAIIGEIINLEDKFEDFGQWLKIKTGNAKDKNFVNGFVTASLTVSIGAMAVVGSIQDGILGDYSLLTTKGILDGIIVLVMTCSLGKGCIFSAIPVAAFQGLVTALSTLIRPLMTELALANISTIGSMMVFCVGLNLVWGKKIRVVNLLPAIFIAVAVAFLPFEL